MMEAATRLHSVHFDALSHSYEGEVTVVRSDGSEVMVPARVMGDLHWTFDRIAREMLRAAHQAHHV